MAVPGWLEGLDGLDIVAIMLLTGVMASRLWLLPASAFNGQQRQQIGSRLYWLGNVGLLLLTITSLGLLLGRSLSMSGMPLSAMGQVVPMVLAKTDFGHVWWGRLAALVLLWGGWLYSGRELFEGRCVGKFFLLLLVVVFALVRGTSGHAGANGDLRLAVGMDALHLLLGGLWGGCVWVFVITVAGPLRHAELEAAWQLQLAKRLSRLAAVGLAGVLITGIYNSWLRLGSWQALLSTSYGHTLDIKLLLVVAMALLGASNRYWHVPAVRKRQPGAFNALFYTSLVEALLVVAVIAAVALLINGMPPAGRP